jgi:hypothetical protein
MQVALPITEDCTQARLSDSMEKKAACLPQLYLGIKLRGSAAKRVAQVALVSLPLTALL